MQATVDPRMTFDSFVVGPANRVAWEAARTSAESPGAAYNPLFIYSDTGLGKTHLLAAIANRARELQEEIRVLYTPVETMLRGDEGEEMEAGLREVEVLLVDDLQFLGNRRENHERLFHVLDHLLLAGRQVVLACDRPPLEMGELDDRLLSRFSGGLVVDIGRPNLETRREILRARLRSLGVELKPDVLDAVARLALENVRQLQGALNRVLATQESQERQIGADEVDRILADVVADPEMPWLSEAEEDGERQAGGEFDEFLDDVSFAVEEALASPKWREVLARAILKWEAEGYSVAYFERLLDADQPVDAEAAVEHYERDVAELRLVVQQLGQLDSTALDGMPAKDPEWLPQLREKLAAVRQSRGGTDEYFRDREKVIWDWPVLEDLLIESWGHGN